MRRVNTMHEVRPLVFAEQAGWRGLRLTLLGVALFVLVASGIGCNAAGQGNRAEEPSIAALPPEVRAALDRAALVYGQPLGGARWSGVSRLEGTGHPLYQVRGTNGRGHKIELEVTSAGRIIEVEEHGIPLDEVPSAVTEALEARMPSFKPTQVEAIYQVEKEQPVTYGFEGQDADGRKVEVYISADGKTFLN